MAKNQLWMWSATDLAGGIRRGDISAVEVTRAHLERIEAVNDRINAVVTLVPDQALEQAQEVDKARAKGRPLGPLAGIPIAHKDLTPTKGIRTTYGSPRFKDFVPNQDAVIIQRIKQAGAVSLGKTNTPEWGAGSQTFNSIFGVTRNPFDLTKTCGGSSGGAAAALAARMIPLADGTDLGGSLRNPASFCNVVGFRTTPGLVPIVPSDNPHDPLPIAGPMARNIDDCALLLGVMSGVHPKAPQSDRPSVDFSLPLNPLNRPVTVGFNPEIGGQLPIDDGVVSSLRSNRQHLIDAGCQLTDACPDLTGGGEAFHVLRAAAFAKRHSEGVASYPDAYKSTILWNVEAGLKLTEQDIHRAEATKRSLLARFLSFFQKHDFLILPVVQVLPFDHRLEYPTRIGDHAMNSYIDWMQSCSIISLTGLPALSLPFGFSPTGLPVGIQIIGQPGADLGVLQLAKHIESQHPVWREVPRLEQGSQP